MAYCLYSIVPQLEAMPILLLLQLWLIFLSHFQYICFLTLGHQVHISVNYSIQPIVFVTRFIDETTSQQLRNFFIFYWGAFKAIEYSRSSSYDAYATFYSATIFQSRDFEGPP